MMLSCVPYLIVQIPLIDGHPAEGPEAALIGAVTCAVGLTVYSAYQVPHVDRQLSGPGHLRHQVRKLGILEGH